MEDLLAANDIPVHFQPIVSIDNMGDNKVPFGFEALSRPSNDAKLLPPEIVFAYAAFKDKLFETDILCIRSAFQKSLQLRPKKLFINVRPISLIHKDFIPFACEEAKKARYAHNEIVFELTEQQAIPNIQATLKSVSVLKRKGFGIALDDFGSGFANLELVYLLEPDYLKISGVFCKNLEKDSRKQVLIRSISELAQRLNIMAILEQIETQEELQAAMRLGIHHGQGYFFGEPLPPEKYCQEIQNKPPKKTIDR